MAKLKPGLDEVESWLRLWQYTTVYEEERFWWLEELVSNPKYAPALQYSLVLLEALLGLEKRCFQLAWINGKPVVRSYEEAVAELAFREEMAEVKGFEKFVLPEANRDQINKAALQLTEFFVDRPRKRWLNQWFRLLVCLLWARQQFGTRLNQVKEGLQQRWKDYNSSQDLIGPAWRSLKKAGLV